MDAAEVWPCQEGLRHLLAVAALKGFLPDEIVLWGAQVGSIDVSLELSPVVDRQVEVLADKVLGELSGWGIEPRPKADGPGRGGG